MESNLVGTSIRSIRLLEQIGEGGMGKVYVGLDENLGRKVAVKAVRTLSVHPPTPRSSLTSAATSR